MATYDLIIRNGTVVDGTGAPRFTGDIAVKDGLIAAVGQVHGDATQELDAAGKVVAPVSMAGLAAAGPVGVDRRLLPGASPAVPEPTPSLLLMIGAAIFCKQ